ncbi:MAG: helix-turn-helix domain-containing protein, partial [bacterium]|nr:helix-turn-helix domain-containing protein [bacterium]
MLNKKQLTTVGLSDKQAVVYLALLELGPSTVSEVARKAGINRTTGYDILEMLVSFGLVSPLGKGKVQKYVTENPEKIIGFAKKQI